MKNRHRRTRQLGRRSCQEVQIVKKMNRKRKDKVVSKKTNNIKVHKRTLKTKPIKPNVKKPGTILVNYSMQA